MFNGVAAGNRKIAAARKVVMNKGPNFKIIPPAPILLRIVSKLPAFCKGPKALFNYFFGAGEKTGARDRSAVCREGQGGRGGRAAGKSCLTFFNI